MIYGLGERLATLRYEHGWTLQEVASKVSMEYSMIAYMERGEREPSLETLVKLSELYDVSLDYLLSGRR